MMKVLLLLTLMLLASDFFGEPFRKGGAEEITSLPSGSSSARHVASHHSFKRHFRAHLRPRANSSLEEFRNLVKAKSPPKKVSIPETFDARDRWPECVTIREIQNQGEGGMCWAYATVAVMNDRTCIKNGGCETFRYSLEDVVSCCENCKGNTGLVFHFWKKQGFVSEDCKPLNSSCDNSYWCNKTCHSGKNYDDYIRKASHRYQVPVEDLRTEIMRKGTVVTSMDVYGDLHNHTAGVYPRTRRSGKRIGSHAVRIIGWGKEGNQDYWLVANSWSKENHEQGIFKIRRGVNECGIESNVWAGELETTC